MAKAGRIALWCVLMAAAGWAMSVAGQGSAAAVLPGSTWRLVSAGEVHPGGKFVPFPEYGPNPAGYLIYDRTGHMCVSLANPVHPSWADVAKPTDAEKLRSYDAFFGYCGKYEVHEEDGQILHLPEVGSYPHYIGSKEFRNFRLEGNRLVLSGVETSPGQGEPTPYEVTWERVQ